MIKAIKLHVACAALSDEGRPGPGPFKAPVLSAYPSMILALTLTKPYSKNTKFYNYAHLPVFQNALILGLPVETGFQQFKIHVTSGAETMGCQIGGLGTLWTVWLLMLVWIQGFVGQ